MIKYLPLYSGSSGNASLFGYGGTLLLIDAGKTCAALCRALSLVKVTPDMLRGVLITHEHTDHISALGVLCRKYKVPVYANAATWAAMEGRVGPVPKECVRLFDTNREFYIDDVAVSPIAVSHDAAEPVCFMLRGGKNGVAHVTDTGVANKNILDNLDGIDIAVVESNHDPDMLKKGSYPPQTKARILSKLGHLSNYDGAALACEFRKSGVTNLILGHISDHNNDRKLAYEVSRMGLEAIGCVPGEDVSLSLAPRDVPTCIYKAGV